MLIEDWPLNTLEAADAVGCTLGQFRNVVERYEIEGVETRRGKRTDYRLGDLLRIRLALDLRQSGLVSLKDAVRIANGSSVIDALLRNDGEIAFGLVSGSLVEMGWRRDCDPRITFPLGGERIIAHILTSVAEAKGAALAKRARAEIDALFNPQHNLEAAAN